MQEDPHCIYFARFVQLVYTFCTNEPQATSSLIQPFKLAKRAFTDMEKSDGKKANQRELRIPREFQQILVNADSSYAARFPDVHPQQPQQ